MAQKWFQSSTSVPFIHGVPHGSTLGPLLLNIFNTSLADIQKELTIGIHVYADDQKLYLAFQIIDLDGAGIVVANSKMYG